MIAALLLACAALLAIITLGIAGHIEQRRLTARARRGPPPMIAPSLAVATAWRRRKP